MVIYLETTGYGARRTGTHDRHNATPTHVGNAAVGVLILRLYIGKGSTTLLACHRLIAIPSAYHQLIAIQNEFILL
jgi:hypothetical protein